MKTNRKTKSKLPAKQSRSRRDISILRDHLKEWMGDSLEKDKKIADLQAELEMSDSLGEYWNGEFTLAERNLKDALEANRKLNATVHNLESKVLDLSGYAGYNRNQQGYTPTPFEG
jgi:chromosome segregation ATPase